jgi:poly(A) polymerase
VIGAWRLLSVVNGGGATIVLSFHDAVPINDRPAAHKPLSDIIPGQSPTIIPRPEHCVSRAQISRNALKVLYRLHQAGYQAFLVGGGVRDLLLEREPKDFDIVTDAHPEDVRRLFRNCRLIGRRFRLAHVHFGPEVIEVATFRAMAEDEADAAEADDTGARVVDDSGRILRDNVYGSIDEDVWRRDFTANALYYNIADFSIWDYVGGVQDVAARTLRMIGDPAQRYAEDPVRMLRAIRFAGKLGFSLHPETAAPIRELGSLLLDVPPARLLDESIKLLLGGAAGATFDLLRDYGLLRYLFPMTEEVLDYGQCEYEPRLIEIGLRNTDARLADEKPVTPIFLFCVLLWTPIRDLALELTEADDSPADEGEMPPLALQPHAVQDATFEVVARQQGRVSIPRRFAQGMSDMLTLQPRFRHQQGRQAVRLYEHPRFRAAWDFLLLRHAAGEPGIDEAMISWWKEIDTLEADEARARLSATRATDGAAKPRRRRRRGGRGRSRGAGEAKAGVGDGDGASGAGDTGANVDGGDGDR